jgi:hypothetical protein
MDGDASSGLPPAVFSPPPCVLGGAIEFAFAPFDAGVAPLRITVFFLRMLPPGEESNALYRFIGDPPAKFPSSGLAPVAIIVDSAPSGDAAPLDFPVGEPSCMDSKSSVIGNGDGRPDFPSGEGAPFELALLYSDGDAANSCCTAAVVPVPNGDGAAPAPAAPLEVPFVG